MRAAVAALLVVAIAGPVAAQPFPDRLELPSGFQPEGIAYARGSLYSGSLVDGAVFRIDARSGAGDILVEGMEGRSAAGMAISRDGQLLFVAGGGTGDAYVYDADTGETVATYDFADGATFVNDVILTRDAAWFTDSFQPVLYRVDLSPRGDPGAATTVPLSGDIEYVPGQFNANGIEATPSGDTLIVVQGVTGELFTVDPDTGVASEIDLGGADVTNGDGLLLRGRTLYVVENFDEVITPVHLSGDLSTGTVGEGITAPGFDIPTTIARRGAWLYAINARFTTPPTADTDYWITVVPMR